MGMQSILFAPEYLYYVYLHSFTLVIHARGHCYVAGAICRNAVTFLPRGQDVSQVHTSTMLDSNPPAMNKS